MSVAEAYRQRVREYDRLAGEARAVERRKADLERQLAELADRVVLSGKVSALFTEMSKDVQDRFLRRVESLVTAGLRAVFSDEFTFTITPVTRRSTVELDFSIGEGADLMGSYGGGVVTLCGVILRIVTVRLLGDRVRQVVVLDEPLAMLSERYVEPAAAFLSNLAHDLDIQLIMVSHQREFAESADAVFRLERTPDGVTVSKSGGVHAHGQEDQYAA